LISRGQDERWNSACRGYQQKHGEQGVRPQRAPEMIDFGSGPKVRGKEGKGERKMGFRPEEHAEKKRRSQHARGWGFTPLGPTS